MFTQALIWLLVYLPVIGFAIVIVGTIARVSGYQPGTWIAVIGIALALIGVIFWVWFVRDVDIG